jgi:hypothetical protein
MNNLNPMKLAEGMLDEVLAVVYKYSESMPVATAIGVLELAKVQVIHDHIDDEEEDE